MHALVKHLGSCVRWSYRALLSRGLGFGFKYGGFSRGLGFGLYLVYVGVQGLGFKVMKASA